ncbi:hypothetical protein Lalb_Chr16g0378281 [Lupinus albus]|uniref:Uncharacterized protein n=1 Tax=Lupinus albus TaxID=3870 RepID=A0A6A4NSK4_LUPAL|nr:hypothetical protein Lalb_Chr16g0378281 [Lupinus albus]
MHILFHISFVNPCRLLHMADIRLNRGNEGPTKIKNVPIAVTPEGFGVCPSPVVFQKSSRLNIP